ncbi:HalX domain-containing protein [Natrialbaceae archaeon A-CW3]
MLPSDPPRVFVVHSNVAAAVVDFESLPFSIRYADFERSILEQFDPEDDVIVLEWGLTAPDARGVLDAALQHVPGTRTLALTPSVPADDPIDRGADEYLVTPVTADQFRSTVEQLVIQHAYEVTLDEYFRLATERAVLKNELDSGVDVGDRYVTVTTQLCACRQRAETLRRGLSETGFDRTLRNLLGNR